MQSNLEQVPVFFECRPCVALQDPLVIKTFVLDIHLKGLRLDDGVLIYSVIFRIYYKLLDTNLAPRAKEVCLKGKTMLLEANPTKFSLTVPNLLDWDQVTRNPVWNIQGATQRIQYAIARIVEHPDGSIDVQFEEETQQPKVKTFI